MIKFDDSFSFERDTYGWSLHELRDGKDKDGKPKRHKYVTYHADLSQVGWAIVDRSAGKCNDMRELLLLLADIKNNVLPKFSVGE